MPNSILSAHSSTLSTSERSRLAVDIVETALLIFLFSSLILKGLLMHRDALYTYLGGFLLFGFTALRYKRHFFFVSKTILAFGLFATFASLSALWSHDAYLVFLDARELVASVPAMIGVHHICRSEAGVRRVSFSMKVVLIAAVAGALLLGTYSYGDRKFLLLNSSMIAPFMLMSFCLLFIGRQTRERFFPFLVSVIAAVIPILIVSSVRAVVVIVAIVGTYVFLLNASNAIGRVIGAVGVVGAAAVIIIYGSAILTALEGTRYFRHYSHMQAYLEEGALEGSVGFRLMAQGLAIEMVKERPVVGHGLNNSRHIYERWIGWPTYSHSGFMELLVGLGWVGFGAFLLIFYDSFRKLRRIWSLNKRGAAAGLAILAGFMIFNFIGPLYSSVELLIVLALLASPGVLSLLRQAPRASTTRWSRGTRWFVEDSASIGQR